ncbi:MAG: hypothetical protein IKO41_15220 [Lachnospiraceae bacterium]|nr:hypothetical protein [Lachnospiraceae bacterium]
MFVSDMIISMSDDCKLLGAPLPGIKATQGNLAMVVRGSGHYKELLKMT